MSGKLRVAREVLRRADMVGYGEIWRAPRGRVRALVTSPCRWRRTWSVLGAAMAGRGVVLSFNGGYGRSSGIVGDAFDKVA